MRRVAPAVVLFVLSPLIAEFLLGDFTLAVIGYLVFLAPLYGGAAVLIREVTRRTRRGWPTIVLLALAFGLLEEGIATQSLFNPDYAGEHLLEHGFVPALGIAVPWTLFVLGLHAVWSVCVPIALTEEWTDRRTVPWLRTPGLIVAAVLVVLGGLTITAFSWSTGHFWAPWPQLATVIVVALALIAAAFTGPRRRTAAEPGASPPAMAAAEPGASPPAMAAAEPGASPRAVAGTQPAGSHRPAAGRAPAPWLVVLLTLAGGSLVMAGIRLDPVPGVLAMLAAYAGVTAALLSWSRRDGWDGRHRLAAAAGAVLTYAWHSFTVAPLRGAGPVITPVSKIVFAVAAVLLLTVEAVRVRRRVIAAAPEREPVPAS